MPSVFCQFRQDVNASELVKGIPDSLLRSLSLSTLEKANLTSVDQLEGHSWTIAQVHMQKSNANICLFHFYLLIIFFTS